MLRPVRNELVLLSGAILMMSVSASNASSSNDTGGLWPASFDFSFASKPEPNTCKSTDMCGTMPGICKHGDCRTRPCSSVIICDCHAGWEGVYCETTTSTAAQNQDTNGATNEPGKTLVNGNVDHTLLKGKTGGTDRPSSFISTSVDDGVATTTDKSNGNGNGLDNGSSSTNGKKHVDNGVKDNGINNYGNNIHVPKTSSTERTTTAVVESTTKSAASMTPQQKATTLSIKISTQEITTKETLKSTTATHVGRPESVGEQINQKLQNGEIKVENVLDVLIASVKENEALAKNESVSPKQESHVATTPASTSKETTASEPVSTVDKPSSAETSTITVAESTSRTTIHPDGSFIKGPESTYLSDNSPLNLQLANKTIKQTVNKRPVKNTTDTVTIPFTVFGIGSARGIESIKNKSDMVQFKQNATTNGNTTHTENNEEKLVKIVESIIIHKPKESVINKSKGTVNIQRSSIDKSAKKIDGMTPSNKKDKNKTEIKSDVGAKTSPVDQKSTKSASQTTKQNLEQTTQTTPVSTVAGSGTTSTPANTEQTTTL